MLLLRLLLLLLLRRLLGMMLLLRFCGRGLRHRRRRRDAPGALLGWRVSLRSAGSRRRVLRMLCCTAVATALGPWWAC